ncbi:MAG: hypothetical protein ACE5EC_09710, partial [Phycisphaerae bacterium]
IKHYVHQTQDQVKIKYAALDAARFVDQTEVIPEEEMRAHFEKYKDVLPEESETGFGYRYPRRVTIQYVTALVSEAERSVKVSLDEIKAHWKGEDDLGNRNRDKYEKTVYVDDPAAPTTAPSSQPAEPPKQIPQQVKMMFSEAKPQIEKELRHKKGIKIARAAMNALARELAKPWNAVPTDKESGYKPIPSEEVKASDFMEKASDRIEAEYGIRLNYDAPEPFSKDALAANPLLGKGKTPGTDAVEIADYAFHVKGFYEPDDASDSTLRLQLYQTPDTPLVVQGKFSRPEFDPMANRWFVKPAEPETFILFRVIDARASAPPSSLENVRAGVEQDIHLMHAFSAMETAVQEFYAVAARLGVDEAFNRFSDYQTERGLSRINTPPAFARNQGLQGDALWEAVSAGKPPWEPSSVVGVGKSEGFIDACFALTAEDWTPPVMDLPQTDRVKAATSQPATETPKKVCLYSELKLRKWFVIELVQNLPVNTRTYEDIHRKGGMSALLNARMTVLRDAWYDPGQIEQRCRYVNVLGAPTPDSREGLQAPPPEKPAGSNL